MDNKTNFSILIVDDQPVNIQLVGALLRPFYKLFVADNGEKAINTAIEKIPDLILLDIMMPGINGYEVCKQLKENPITKEIPIIFLTARTESDDIVHGFELGGVDYITKPFNQNEILVRIKTHLEVKSSRDIIKKQNEELMDYKDRLEAKNTELEKAMTLMEQNFHELNNLYNRILANEAELEKSNAEMAKLNEEKDRFFSIIAHDLRNPFSGLLGMTDLMYKSFEVFEKEELIEMMESVYDTVRNIYKFLEDLLEWSRAQQGRISLEIEQLDIAELVFNTLFIVQNSADKKNISINNQIQYDTLVRCDRNMIGTVIRNLITNAVKFTHNNGKITISSEYILENETKYLKFCVEDTGIGMNEETANSLFGLVKTGNSRFGTSNEKGTGLGLVISKDFIEKHKGNIWVESKENVGSKFYFTLPV